MDPITLALALAAVVGASTTAMSIAPHLKRRMHSGSSAALQQHGLCLSHGIYSDAVPVTPALFARVSHSSEATRGLTVFVRAPSTWTGLRTAQFWARRHENLGDDFLLELPLVNSEGPARGTPGRWRKVAAGCFVGAMPAANADAYADDFAVCAALTMLLQRQHAEIESIDGALLLRFNRPASLSVEAEVRRCLDVSRSVIAVLDKVGERLPDLHDAELPDLLPESSAPSSSGAPLLVRGIR